jgi:pilus assembly protein CpaB
MQPSEQTLRDEAAAHNRGELGRTSRRALLFSAVLGVLGAILLLLYLQRFEEEVSGGGRVSLLTVRKPIARGQLISSEALTVSSVPRAYVEQRAVRQSDLDKIIGVRAASALAPQDTLLWSDLALSPQDRDLASLLQPGKRAVSVRASETGSDPAGNGLLRPGDYVDVVVTLRPEQGAPAASVVLLQRVIVLAVGSETEPQRFTDGRSGQGARDSERELTLSLNIEEMQLLSLARERGNLSVALRGPDDVKVVENIADMPISTLYDKAVRQVVQRQARDVEAIPTKVPSVR